MKHLLVSGLVALFAFHLGGCSATRGSLKNPEIKTVAVVSFALNEWRNTATMGIGGSQQTERAALQKAADQLLSYTEDRLAKRWLVKKASTFVNNQAYQALAVSETLDAYVPIFNGRHLGMFTGNSMALKRGRLDSDQAVALCSALGVDAVFVIYSEWTVKRGNAVPITKPLTKNVVAVWDKEGRELYARRIDQMGSMVIGPGDGSKISLAIPGVLNDFQFAYKKALEVALK